MTNDILPKLREWCDALLVVSNDKLVKRYPKLTTNGALDKEAVIIGKAARKLMAVHKTLKSISWYGQIDEK